MNNNVNNQQPMRQPLKQCKYCKQPIAAKASVCPYCRKSQSSAGLVVILVLLSILACFLIFAFIIVPIMQGYQKREQEIKHNNYVVSTEAPTQAPTESTTAEINQLLYDANDIKIYYKGASSERSRVKFHIYIENNSNREVCIQTRDFAINGYMINDVFTPQVAAGKKINDTINVYTKYLDENNITQINDVEFYFHIFNWDDWEDKIDTDVIHLEG